MDSYREPNVRIEVIEDGFSFVGPVTGLPPMIFGPIFQVEVKASFGTYDGTQLTAAYPDLKTDAEVDTDAVELYIIHGDTGYEYNVVDDLEGAPTIGDASVILPASLYSTEITGTTGRANGDPNDDGWETFGDAAADFSNVQYGDQLVMLDDEETVDIDTVDGDGNLKLQPGESLGGENILYYDTLAVSNFEVGEELTIPAEPAATATILFVYEDPDVATQGYLILGAITGSFDNNDVLLGATSLATAVANSDSAQATVDSILYYDGFIYDDPSVSIDIGDTITNGVATATVLYNEEYDSGTAGFMLLSTVVGDFVDDDDIIIEDNVEILFFDTMAVDVFEVDEDIDNGAGVTAHILAIDIDEVAGTGSLTICNVAGGDFIIGDAITGSVSGTTAVVTVANVDIALATCFGAESLLGLSVDRLYEVRRPVIGEAYISYRACRADLDGSIYYCTKYSDVLDLVDDNEDAMIPENPLAYAGKICTDMNSECFLVPVQDLEGYLDPSDSTNASAWANAFALARDYEMPYSYVVLNQNEVVRAYLEIAVNWKRDPDNYMNEVVAYFCPQRVTEDVAITERVSGTGAVDANTWEDANIADFTAYGCLAGRTLELIDADGVAGDEGVAYEFTVSDVSETQITTIEAMTAEQMNILTYRYVNEYYDADAEALALGVYGQSIENKAMRLIYPATIQMDNTEVPGCYLGVIRAAQLNINRPATIYTGARVPVVERALTTFTRTQLNTVASGGIMVFYHMNTDILSGANSPIKCRDAITTDRTNAAREEEVVVTEVDYSSRYIRGVFLPEMGRHHNDEMLSDGISMLVGGCQSHLVDEIKCISRLTLESYEIDEDEVRKINYEWSLEPRYPNKWADMVIHVVT